MITVLDLRRHILTAADALHLPLTLRQVDQLANRIAASAARGTTPTLHITQQQHAILVGLACGEEVEETGRRLALSTDTVKSHRRRLYKALGARNGPHAVTIALSAGLLRTAPQAAGADRDLGQAGGVGAVRAIAARHEAAYGEVWAAGPDPDAAWADAIASLPAQGGAA